MASSNNCCCNSMHITTATVLIGVWHMGISAVCAAFVLFIGNLGDQSSKTGYALNCLLTSLACVMLFHGLWSRNMWWLVPHMLYQVFSILALVILTLLAVISSATAAFAKTYHVRIKTFDCFSIRKNFFDSAIND